MSNKHFLIHDFETKSLVDLEEVGGWNYIRHPSTRVLMMSWAIDNGPVQLWLPHKNPNPPKEYLAALRSREFTKVAFNAPFEHDVNEILLGEDTPHADWVDLMIWARNASLSGGLADVQKALGFAEDKQKLQIGDQLIRLFGVPFRLGGNETLFGVTEPEFHDWVDRPKEWEQFEEYCIRDTESERELFRVLWPFRLPPLEHQLWQLDQKINRRGLPINRAFVTAGNELALRGKDEETTALQKLTNLENPNSPKQFLGWASPLGYPFTSLNKQLVNLVLKSDRYKDSVQPIVREALILRKRSAKSSYTKFERILQAVSADGYIRNQFNFMGAARSGRWSSRQVQMQNMTRPIKAVEAEKDYLNAMRLILSRDYDGIKTAFADQKTGAPASVLEVVTSCLRGVIQAPPGKKLVVADLNAIENRGLGYCAACPAILEVFYTNRCPYLSFGADLRKLNYDDLVVLDAEGNPKAKDAFAKLLRTIAKPAVLGAGYGLSAGEEDPDTGVKTGLRGYAENMGIDLSQEDADNSIETFRRKYAEVPEYWKALERAAIQVITTGGQVRVGVVVFDRIPMPNGKKGIVLRIKLPSGRYIHYFNAQVRDKKYKNERTGDEYWRTSILYYGIGHGVGAIGGGGWGPVWTYGGKLCENIVQAISRDILANAMILADSIGFEIVGHVHDEIIALADEDSFLDVAELKACMNTVPEWLPGFPLGSAGYEAKIYRKD